MEQKNLTGPMDKAEAQAITDRIRGHIDAAWSDIERAYEGRAWRALGYASWEAYVRDEFDMSRRHSYRLIDQARVIHEIAKAAGEDVTRVSQISVRDAAAVKSDLPAVAAEIKQRVEGGEDPKQAVKEAVNAARAAKAEAKAHRQPEQAQNDALRNQTRGELSPAVQALQQAKAEAIAARKAKSVDVEALTAEIEELREANAALEADVARLTAENNLYAEMKVQFEQGGFDKVIADKDEEIRVLETRLYRESEDKASWMASAKAWRKRAEELGFSPNAEIDIETGKVING